ncbi:transketolase C-terminal domain-containing protein [Chitinophaga costaii]|uniref:transketolase C-terminal domain-containing protein n=1 Tax=Chitinophaga costaii TaxID=1335309 RepID=UPI000F4D6692|nr:transketolase C-terminal domain-containing protein [Chitinophaga costaii]
MSTIKDTAVSDRGVNLALLQKAFRPMQEARWMAATYETLFPLDEVLIYDTVRRHGKCLVFTEEPVNNSFAQALTGRIQQICFRQLDAPVQIPRRHGSANSVAEGASGSHDDA